MTIAVFIENMIHVKSSVQGRYQAFQVERRLKRPIVHSLAEQVATELVDQTVTITKWSSHTCPSMQRSTVEAGTAGWTGKSWLPSIAVQIRLSLRLDVDDQVVVHSTTQGAVAGHANCPTMKQQGGGKSFQAIPSPLQIPLFSCPSA